MSTTSCCPVYHGVHHATATADGNSLVITLKHFCPAYILQGDRVTFIVTHCITYPQTKINDVKIDVNGTEFTATKFGDVKWDQIKNRTPYTIVFGTDDLTATILHELPPSRYDYPVFTTTSTTTEEVSEDE